ncbi:hypothetical protein JI435_404640, partial [Parastagonospora nodorum SN15]
HVTSFRIRGPTFYCKAEPRLPPIRSLKLPSIGSSNASPTTPHSSTPPSHAKERNAKRHDHARMAVPVLQRNKPRPRHA